jgi:MFS family permease
MSVGWAVSSLSMFILLTFSDLGRHFIDDGTGKLVAVPNDGAPSIPFLSFCLLIFGMGYWLADVMGDSIVAEKSKLEPEHSRGHLQSTCYACRFFGVMVAAPLSTVLYSTFGPQLVIKLMALAPMTMLPFIYNLWELKDIEIKSAKEQCAEIWKTVCSRAVWQPMGFVRSTLSTWP